MAERNGKRAYDPRKPQVNILSVQSSKGLEFSSVIFIGLGQIESSETQAAQNMKLLYVGMTRAKSRLTLSLARRRMAYGEAGPSWREREPSRFLGDLPPDLARVDGTPAENMFIRALDTSVTLGDLERSRGQLVVVSGRINGKVSISVEAYQLGAENSKERVRAVVAETLAEFGLNAVVD